MIRIPIWCIARSAVSFFRSIFGLDPYFPVYVILCIGSSLIFSLGSIMVLLV